MNKRNYLIFLFLIIIPIPVFANAGSPMMWFGIFHLFVINLFIGIIESMIINYFGFKHRMGFVILANYISMIVGLVLIAPLFSSFFGNQDFWGGQTTHGDYDIPGFFFGFVFSFFATLLVEYPIIKKSSKNINNENPLKEPFLVANITTNCIMFLIYFLIVLI